MVPDAEFTSYYGRPVIKEPVWQAPDVAGYLFFGGLAGASSVLAASAHLSGHRDAGPGGQADARSARSACPRPPSSTTWAGPRASPTCCGSSSPARR